MENARASLEVRSGRWNAKRLSRRCIEGSGSGVDGYGSRVEGAGSGVEGYGSGIEGYGSRVDGSGTPEESLEEIPRASMAFPNGRRAPRALLVARAAASVVPAAILSVPGLGGLFDVVVGGDVGVYVVAGRCRCLRVGVGVCGSV